MTDRSVGVVVIATGGYLDFADQLLVDLDRVVPADVDLTANVFTDALDGRREALVARHRVGVRTFQLPSLRWPEASLRRYEIFERAANELHQDVMVYLDADLRVRRDPTRLLDPTRWPGGMAAVQHPGFWRPRRLRPRGTWETRRASAAYVPPWRRRRYVCGGVWMGARDAFLSTSQLLASRVRRDRELGLTAVWHDESHWNWYVAHHRTRLFDPTMCWVPDYPWLARLDPIVEAVDKGRAFERINTSHDVRTRPLTVESDPRPRE